MNACPPATQLSEDASASPACDWRTSNPISPCRPAAPSAMRLNPRRYFQFRRRSPFGRGALRQESDFSWLRQNWRKHCERCDECGKVIPAARTDAVQDTLKMWVGNVRAVPSQQELRAIHCCERNMSSIGCRTVGQVDVFSDASSEFVRFSAYIENHSFRKQANSPPGHHGFAARSLLCNERGRQQLIPPPPLPPPAAREPLAAEEERVARRTRREVTHDGRLNVDGRFHFPAEHHNNQNHTP